MSTLTPKLNLLKAAGSDVIRDYLKIDLAASLDILDARISAIEAAIAAGGGTTGTGAPTGVVAQARPSEVRLSWTAPTTVSPFAYEIRRGTAVGGPYSAISCGGFARAVTAGLSWIDPDVTNGTTYYYTVRTIMVDGTISPDSAEVTASPTWPTWTERGYGSDVNSLISAASSGATVPLPDGIYRVRSDSDWVSFNKSITLKATNPGKTQILASRNWATGGEAGNTWSGTGPWGSSLTVPTHTADEDSSRSADVNGFLATTYEHVVGFTSNGTATDFVRIADGGSPGAGQWCWPSSGDRHLRIGSNPASFTRIEVTSGAKRFASCSASNVTIQDLTWHHVGGGTRNSAVGNDDQNNWIMKDCTVGYSHSGGPRVGDAGGTAAVTIQRNYIHDCVHIGSSSDNLGSILLESNRFEHTGYNWYDTLWEGGCTKFTRNLGASNAYIYRYNEAGRNTQGFGLWFDESGNNPTVVGNRWQAKANALHFEISNGGSSTDNCWLTPSTGWTGWPTEYISTSSNHSLLRNTVVSYASRAMQMYGDGSRGHGYSGNSSTSETLIVMDTDSNHHAIFNNTPMGPINGAQVHFRSAGFQCTVDGTDCFNIGALNATSSAEGCSVLDNTSADAALKKWGVIS
jgi:hypothetical protein